LPRLRLELILYGGYAVGITNDANLLRDGHRDLLGFGHLLAKQYSAPLINKLRNTRLLTGS